MNRQSISRNRNQPAARPCGAFTLIELLVVMAIITLLISILVPSLVKARDQAKMVKTRAMLKSISEGLELFRNQNEADRSMQLVSGYPRCALGEDAAMPDAQLMVGAHWLVRYLMGLDLKGYAPRSHVPPELLNPQNPTEEEVRWYENDSQGRPLVSRVGPYLDMQGLRILHTAELPGRPNPIDPVWGTLGELVFVDQYDNPVLYYVANPSLSAKSGADPASYDGTYPGIYTMADNALFTGQGYDMTGLYGGWDFGGGAGHPLGYFGKEQQVDPLSIRSIPQSFPCYILDQEIYSASYNPGPPPKVTALPCRPESYLLITAGKDELYGTTDDVNNFR